MKISSLTSKLHLPRDEFKPLDLEETINQIESLKTIAGGKLEKIIKTATQHPEHSEAILNALGTKDLKNTDMALIDLTGFVDDHPDKAEPGLNLMMKIDLEFAIESTGFFAAEHHATPEIAAPALQLLKSSDREDAKEQLQHYQAVIIAAEEAKKPPVIVPENLRPILVQNPQTGEIERPVTAGPYEP